MKSINNNVITYNGEIYNYLELKKNLQNNWDFISNTDTEVILALYSKYKEKVWIILKECFHSHYGMISRKSFFVREIDLELNLSTI